MYFDSKEVDDSEHSGQRHKLKYICDFLKRNNVRYEFTLLYSISNFWNRFMTRSLKVASYMFVVRIVDAEFVVPIFIERRQLDGMLHSTLLVSHDVEQIWLLVLHPCYFKLRKKGYCLLSLSSSKSPSINIVVNCFLIEGLSCIFSLKALKMSIVSKFLQKN